MLLLLLLLLHNYISFITNSLKINKITDNWNKQNTQQSDL